ncbi:MAG: hypothetical protein ACRDOO_07260 [Actinomadura sp.]
MRISAVKTGRRRRRYFWLVFGLLIAVAFALPYGLHALRHPWAISLTGQPTLTGSWYGEVPFAPGDERQVVVKLRSEPPIGPCRNCSPIDGELTVCTKGRPLSYRFIGDVGDRSARRFSLSAIPGDPPGRYLRWLEGEWAHGDQIGITATLVVKDADRAIRSEHQPAQPVRFTMRRGTGGC